MPKSKKMARTQLENRAIDESPATAGGPTREVELRHPVDAPGQLPAHARKQSGKIDADEYYGQTEIPRDEGSTGARDGTDANGRGRHKENERRPRGSGRRGTRGQRKR